MMSHPYKDFLHALERPARYVGQEYGAVRKEDVDIRFALAFPDAYEIGMSHLGYKILYKILNDVEDVAAERVFAPGLDLEAELRKRSLPLLSLESARPLSSFDIVGFSLQYELTYANVLNMLDLGGIPLRSRDRSLKHPLILAGGPCATSPEAMSSFVDAFVIGDGEEMALNIARAWSRWKKEGRNREEGLEELATWTGVYVPSCYRTERDEKTDLVFVSGPKTERAQWPVKRSVVSDLSRFPFPTDSPVPFTEVVFDRFAVELARGCTEGCRFCQAGMIYRPVREREPGEVLLTLQDGLAVGGYEQGSLTSLSTADYSSISPLLRKVLPRARAKNISLGISSLRAYGLPEDVMDEMARGRVTGLTFAPEAGTQRMRDVIAKNVKEEDIERTARNVFSRGWSKMKLYFMIGLPTENDEDVYSIGETARRVRDLGRSIREGRRADVTVSVSSHVPKPHTPFQWAGMDSMDEIRRKQDVIRFSARKHRLAFRSHNIEMSHLEGVLARGDVRLGDVIERAFQLGCRFDGWDEHFQFDRWAQAFSDCDVDRQVYLRPLRLDGNLPWQHIDVGVRADFLKREYTKALAGTLSIPCGKPAGEQSHHTNTKDHEEDSRKLVCYHCGIECDLDGMKANRGKFLEQLEIIKAPVFSGPVPVLPEEESTAKEHSFRFMFTKLMPACWVSHLDLIRALERIFRRAEIPMAFSSGFHPKPRMSFGPALALGLQSIAEVMDCVLYDERPGGVLLSKLNEVADPGIRFWAAERLTSNKPGLAHIIQGCEYLVSISHLKIWEEARKKWDSAEPLLVMRERKGRQKEMDVRQHVFGLEAFEGPSPVPDLLAPPLIRARLHIRPEGSLRLSEVQSVLFAEMKGPLQAVRTGFLRRVSEAWVPAFPGSRAENPAEAGEKRPPRARSLFSTP